MQTSNLSTILSHTLFTLLMFACFCFQKTFGAIPHPVIVDHDGGVDDMVALTLVATTRHLQLKAVTITPADCFPNSALYNTRKLLSYLHHPYIPIAVSEDIGLNPFPSSWRADSDKLKTVFKPLPSALRNPVKQSASDLIIKTLLGNQHVDILVTGPMTNIAEALKRAPEISSHIHRIYFMGGAFKVIGNVLTKQNSPTAEWNVFNNPSALQTVLKSKVPIVFVALDATNQTPVTPSFINQLAKQAKYSQLSALMYQAWHVIWPQISTLIPYQKKYFFWDTLAAMVLIQPSIGKTTHINMNVNDKGETREVLHGYPAMMITSVNKAKFEQTLLHLLNQR